jgi:hypothetical protein
MASYSLCVWRHETNGLRSRLVAGFSCTYCTREDALEEIAAIDPEYNVPNRRVFWCGACDVVHMRSDDGRLCFSLETGLPYVSTYA